MEKFFKVILNDEEQAFKASQEIVNLAEQGEIKVNELFIITRKENGEIKILDVKSGKVPYTTSGSMIGGLLGILGGPIGVLFGMTTGMMAGGIGDLIRMSKSKKFVDKATKAIPQGQTAILGNIIETWEIPLNTTLKPFESQIQRISIDEALANFAEEEQQKINIDIDALQHKIKNSSEEEKDKLEYELSKLQVSSAILTKDIPVLS